MKIPSPRKVRFHTQDVAFLFAVSAFMACSEQDPMVAASPQNPVAALAAAATPITTLQGLRNMSPTGNYILGANIDASSTATTPFVPIGTFTGSFDGGGYAINNLHISGGKYTGLFSQTDGANLTRIHLNNVSVSGGSIVGAIIGAMWNGTRLTDSYVAGGTVSGTGTAADVGMAVGFAGGSYGLIQRCYATGTVNGAGTSVGGFIGKASGDGIKNGDDDPRVKLYEIFTNVNVNPNTPAGVRVEAGGLVGTLMGADVRSINVVGAVRGQYAAGGIIGAAYNDFGTPSTIRYMLYRNNVVDAATPNRAGVIGYQEATFMRCDQAFWSKESDGGTPSPSVDGACQLGMKDSVLKAPHPNPNRYLWPYIVGDIVTQQMINTGGYDQCKLASGTDTDWGFGQCTYTPLEWDLNSSTQHITLHNIPNPSIQPR